MFMDVVELKLCPRELIRLEILQELKAFLNYYCVYVRDLCT